LSDDLDLMTNLYPRTTGLPMVIWVGPRYAARHDVRIKAMQHHGNRMDPGDLAVVALRPNVHVVAGQLSAADLDEIRRWVDLNWDAILAHWEERIDGAELVQRLRRL
jgi:Domain of unknown function (DUF4160)